MPDTALPVGWTRASLAQIAEIVMGQSPPGHTYNRDGVGLPLINGPVEFGDRYPSKIQWTTAPTKLCQFGDVLFCVRGSTTGRMNISNDDYCLGRGVAAIRGRSGIAITSFLERLLAVLAVQILEEAKGSGSTFPSINAARLAAVEVLVPTLPEQHKIAAILDAVDNAIQKTEQIVAKLKQVKQGLLHDLLTRGIDDNGELRDPNRHPEQFTDSALGRIPTRWRSTQLSTVAEVRTGIAKNSNRAVRNPLLVHYLRVANVQDGFLDLSEMSEIIVAKDDLDRYRVLPGDVLMNEGGDLDKLGRGGIWRGEFDPCVHQNHVFVVRCRDLITSEFLNAWTGSSFARRYFMVAGKQTTNLASINKTALGRLPVVVPPRAEQFAVMSVLAESERRVLAEESEVRKLLFVKAGLMEALLTGRARVTKLLTAAMP